MVREGASRRGDDKANTKIRSTVTGTVLEVPVEEGGSVIEANNFNEGTTIAMVADMNDCLLYTSPSPRDGLLSRMPSSA